MDKETLSNYGWIVICVLVMAVMIALSTPFGNFIGDAVWNTMEGLFYTGENALIASGVIPGEPNIKTVSGSCILLNNVNKATPNLRVTLSSDTVTDFSAVTVSRYGSNMLNISGMIGRDLVDNGDGTYTLTHNSGNYARSQQINIYIPAGTTIHLSAECVESTLASGGLGYTLRYADGTSKGGILFDMTSPDFAPDNIIKAQKDVVAIQFVTISGATNIGEYVTFTKPKMNISQELPYEEYVAPQTVTANADGTIEGIIPITPHMTLVTENNDVEITCTYNKTDLAYDLQGKTILNFGDSIFGYYQAPRSISAHISNLTDATVYNVAFGGCSMSQSYKNWDPFAMYRLADSIATGDWSVQDNAIADSNLTHPDYFEEHVNTLKTIDFNNVDIITIAYGTNDFGTDKPLDDVNNNKNTNTVAGALRYSIETISAAYPDIDIVICTPIYRYWIDGNGELLYDSNTYVNDGGYKLTDISETLENIAVQYDLVLIDNYTDCGIAENNKEKCLTDGTHPSLIGCKLIAENMAKELYNHFG